MQTKTAMKYFTGSFVFTAVCLAISAWMGYNEGGVAVALATVYITALLAGLEISVSIDNAVVNASVLRHMSPFWRKFFVTVGIAVAVFGMRILFPIMIVDFASGTGYMEAFRIATTEPDHYQEIMKDSHVAVMAFGGAFLLTVFLEYFMNAEKDVHWLPGAEHVMSKAGSVKFAETLVFLLVIAATSLFVAEKDYNTFLVAAASGWAVHMVIHFFKEWVGGGDIAAVAARNGFIGFMYLEVLDASFSFDGVVSAFAITNHFWTIALGLGIGAMFVRSMTLYLVDKGTLTEFEYLEPAAFWAIGFLVLTMMLASIHIELGELVVGGGSMLIIGAGLYASIRANRNEEAEAVTA